MPFEGGPADYWRNLFRTNRRLPKGTYELSQPAKGNRPAFTYYAHARDELLNGPTYWQLLFSPDSSAIITGAASRNRLRWSDDPACTDPNWLAEAGMNDEPSYITFSSAQTSNLRAQAPRWLVIRAEMENDYAYDAGHFTINFLRLINNPQLWVRVNLLFREGSMVDELPFFQGTADQYLQRQWQKPDSNFGANNS